MFAKIFLNLKWAKDLKSAHVFENESMRLVKLWSVSESLFCNIHPVLVNIV